MPCIKRPLCLPAFAAIIFMFLAQAHTSIIRSYHLFQDYEAGNRTNGIKGQCFDQHSYQGIHFTNLADCRLAIGKLVRQPGFTVNTHFSRSQKFGVNVPKEWRNQDCTIYVGCLNDYDGENFSYADIAQRAQKIITACVQEKAHEPYGGIEQVGKLGSFYVTSGASPDVHLSLGNMTSEEK